MKEEARYLHLQAKMLGDEKKLHYQKKGRSRTKSLILMKQTETEWIRNHIYTKVRIPSTTTNKPDDYEIEEAPTKAFGVIDFKGAARKTKAKFVQLSDDTSAEVLVELFSKWKIPNPQMVIAVTGGAKSFKSTDDSLKESVANGLRKIAQSPGTWVMTGGTNIGVMKFVGESLQGVSDSVIGVATWGVIANSECLLPKPQSPVGGTFNYEVANSIVEEGSFLDQNHTHFLLVDDSTVGEFGKEILLCSRLLKHITYRQDVPTVLLVFEGGLFAIDNILNAVTGDNPIPVVVVKDSGRAASVISSASLLSEESGVSKDVIHEDIHKNLTKYFSDLKSKEKDALASKITKCLKQKKLITVFDVAENEGVDKSILSAILESHDDLSQGRKLQYSLVWNRVDIAEELMADRNNKWEKLDFENAMVMALAMNRHKFVELFLEHCIGVQKLVTRPLLEFLYGYRSTRHGSIVRYEITEENFDVVDKEHKVYSDLLKGFVYGNEPEERKYIKYEGVEGLISLLCDELKLTGNETFLTAGNAFSNESTYSDRPYLDLFIWAVVNNMHRMSLFLWKLGEEQVAKAIVAAHINKKLADLAQEKGLSSEIVQQYRENEKTFKDIAIGVIGSCDCENMRRTKILLTMRLVQFNSHNCLSLAHAASFQEFIAHTAVQQLLHELWSGKIFFTNNIIQSSPDGSFAVDSFKNGSSGDSISQRKHLAVNTKLRPKTSSHIYEETEIIVPENKSKVQQMKEIFKYYYMRPASKFYRNLISYCCFLLLFAYISMARKTSTTPGPVEIFVCVWVVSLTFEEIYQMAITPGTTFFHKLEAYFGNVFNIIDVFAIGLYFVAFAVHLRLLSTQYGHLLYAVDAVFWIVRLLQYFYANKILGPYVLMIGKMFIDMCYFISILGVFLLAYGVLSASLLKPEAEVHHMIRDVIFYPYFNIYGELFIERDAEPGKTRFGTDEMNSYAETISLVSLGIFLLIANVLLLNLLIAIFGNTFTKVQEKSDQIWKFNLYGLITEYALKPPVAPPLTIFFHIWMFLKWMLQWVCHGKVRSNRTDSSISDMEREEIEELQMKHVVSVIRERKTESGLEALDKKLDDMTEKFKNLQDQLSQIQRKNKMSKKFSWNK